jgi:hypothetical protein
MAQPVILCNRRTGEIRTGYYGFSWTSLIWGGFPALFRGDIGAGLAVVLIGVAAAALTYGIGWYVVALLWAVAYNKSHLNGLLDRGYEFSDNPDIVAATRRAVSDS